MKVIENEKAIFFDCDDTLVCWDNIYKTDSNTIDIADPYYEPGLYAKQQAIYTLVPHEKHIKYLKDSKTKNHNTIIVWSAGGWKWAEAVVKALKLEEYVDAVMEKPTMYVDDLPCKEFMGIRKYEQMPKPTNE